MLRNLVLLAILTSLAACAHDPRLSRDTLYLTDSGSVVSMPERGRSSFDNVSYWDGDGFQGKPSVIIHRGEQKAYFYKAGQLVGISSLSTGREGLETPLGKFKIIQKDKDHVSSRFGDYLDAATGAMVKKDADREKDPLPPGARYDGAKMPYFMRIVGGTGMHEGFLPGYPASHGCIRMPGFMAEAFFRSVEVGTPVEIAP
jgi:lipoprotein-anchoring transpeptidase ErfK/SrfK